MELGQAKLGARIWEKARDKTTYRRREPERTELYRIIYQERDNLERFWEEHFQSQFGVLRDCVKKTLDEYLNCGILAHGCARAVCQTCNHSELVAFSYKKRGVCPSCAAKRAVLFAEHIHENVLPPVPQRHCVFSIPKRLRVFFRYNRSLLSILYHAAWKTIKDLVTAAIPGGTTGAILVAQSAGNSINFNPHLHGIIPSGVFTDTGFVPIEKFSAEKATEIFALKVLSALKSSSLISDTAVAQILSQTHSGFSVWFGDEVPKDDASYRLFISRYIDRGPVAGDRISITDNIVTYLTHKDDLTCEFSPLEFLARLTPHIPNKWEQTVRYFGQFSARTRGKLRKLSLHQDNQMQILEPLENNKASKSWAALIKRIYEVDPLVCPQSLSTN